MSAETGHETAPFAGRGAPDSSRLTEFGVLRPFEAGTLGKVVISGTPILKRSGKVSDPCANDVSARNDGIGRIAGRGLDVRGT